MAGRVTTELRIEPADEADVPWLGSLVPHDDVGEFLAVNAAVALDGQVAAGEFAVLASEPRCTASTMAL